MEEKIDKDESRQANPDMDTSPAEEAVKEEAESITADRDEDMDDTESLAEDAEQLAEEAMDTAAEKLEQAKKSLFSNKDKKEKKDKKDEKIEELSDRLMRQMAEFDNFRKRTEREKAQMFDYGARDILEKILPTVDNFERGFAGLSEEEMATPFAQGMDKVYKQLAAALDGAGVKAIEAVGKEFDPNLHNAVMHIDDEAFGENIVAEEFQKGYTYHDTVIRHSMVKVAN